MQESESAWVPVGKVLRPFGVRGALKIYLDNPASATLRPGISVRLVSPQSRSASFLVKDAYGSQLFLETITTCDLAEKWRNARVEVARADLPVLADDEVYLADLMGAKVCNEEGVLLGEIIGFSTGGPQLVAELACADGTSFMVPFVPPLVTRISVTEKCVWMDLPEGLLP